MLYACVRSSARSLQPFFGAQRLPMLGIASPSTSWPPLLLLSFMVTVLGFLVLKLILAHPTSEKVGDSCSTTVKKYSRTPHQFSRTFPSNASLPSHYFQTIKTPDMTYCSRLTMRENSRVLFSAGRVGKKKCRFLTFYFFLVLFTGPAEMRRE